MNVKTQDGTLHKGTVHCPGDEKDELACGRTVYKFMLPLIETDEELTCKRCLAQIHVNTVRSGQPRPYADSTYEYIITDLAPKKRDREAMLAIAKLAVKHSLVTDEMPHPFAAHQRSFYETDRGTWHYRVTELFTG